MTNPSQSKFLLVPNHEDSAPGGRRRPDLAGAYWLAEKAPVIRLVLWCDLGAQPGKPYAKGITNGSTSDPLHARSPGLDVKLPETIDLKNNEAIMFKNDKAAAGNKEPHYIGYVREANCYVQLKGWECDGVITGTAELYQLSAAP